VPAKYVLDTNCYIDADHDPTFKAAFEAFSYAATPFLYLNAITAAELQTGVPEKVRKVVDTAIVEPFRRRRRIVAPLTASWEALGTTLSWLHEHEGLALESVKRSFIFDILIAHCCREIGATLISNNIPDLQRIAQVFTFDYAPPFPALE
jgi:predicted nucleic acid-binding protein